MIFRLSPLVILAAPALAQESGANANFYHAYWLEHGADRYREAIAAYQKFLSEAPDNKHAPSAAASLLSLLYRTGDTQAADEFKKSHSQLIAKDQKRFSNRLQAGSTSDSRQPGTVMRNRIADMKKQQREAKEKGRGRPEPAGQPHPPDRDEQEADQGLSATRPGVQQETGSPPPRERQHRTSQPSRRKPQEDSRLDHGRQDRRSPEGPRLDAAWHRQSIQSATTTTQHG